MMTPKKIGLFTFISLIVISTGVLAHGGATGIVKERMDKMKVLKKSVKALKPIFKDEIDYDVYTVKQNAKMIEENAGQHLTSLFPEGSIKKPSEAKPAIWENWDEFTEYANNLERLGKALQAGAENSSSSMHKMMHPKGMGSHSLNTMTDEQLASMPSNALFSMIVDNCSSCHKKFKED